MNRVNLSRPIAFVFLDTGENGLFGSDEKSSAPTNLGETSLVKLLGSLTPKQLCGLGSAITAVAAMIFALGGLGRPIVNSVLSRPKTCADMKGYPRGFWNLSAVKIISGDPHTNFSDSIFFTDDDKGVWYAGEGKQLPDGTYPRTERREFSAQPAPVPGGNLTITFHNPHEEFSAIGTVVVSPDGCSMDGDAVDSMNGKVFLQSKVRYDWQQSAKSPDLSGWRGPVESRQQPEPKIK